MSFKSQLRKLLAIGAIFALALAGTLATAPAQAAPAGPVQVSSNLIEPAFIADFNGGLYFTASPDAGNTYNIYFYDGSSDPKIVAGGEDSDPMEYNISTFGGNIYFNTGNAAYKLTKGVKQKVTKPWASLEPHKFRAIGKNLYFQGKTSAGDYVLFKWDGKTANPTSLEGVGNAPMNFRNLEQVGNHLTISDSDKNLWISNDASGTANPVFTHITFDVNGTAYETREPWGFVKVGTKIFFSTHESYNGNYTVMYVDVASGTPSQAADPHFTNGDRLVNASAPVRMDAEVYIIGARADVVANTVGGNTLYTINDAGDFVEAAGMAGANAQIPLSTNQYYGDPNVTGVDFIGRGGRLFLTDYNSGALYTYKSGTLAPITYKGNQLYNMLGVATVGKKILFGSHDVAMAYAATPDEYPILTMDIASGSITGVTVPNHLTGAFAAAGHLFFRARADIGSPDTLWVDEAMSKPADKATKVVGFYGDSSWVNPDVAKSLKKLASSPSSITAVVCTGTTAGTKATNFDKKLALARATAACKYIKSLAKNAKTSVVAKPATGAAYSNRAVLIEITR